MKKTMYLLFCQSSKHIFIPPTQYHCTLLWASKILLWIRLATAWAPPVSLWGGLKHNPSWLHDSFIAFIGLSKDCAWATAQGQWVESIFSSLIFLISCLGVSVSHLPRIMIFLNITFLFQFPSSRPPAQPRSCVSLLCGLGVQTDPAETLTWLGAGTHAGLGAARRGLTCFYWISSSSAEVGQTTFSHVNAELHKNSPLWQSGN